VSRQDFYCDGVSFAHLLRGDDGPDRGPIFWHYPHYGNQGGAPGCSMRSGDYKLIEFFEDDSIELYNLREDPGEKRDLVAAEPERAEDMRRALADWRESVHAKVPGPNPEWDPH